MGPTVEDIETQLKPLLIVTKKFQLHSLFRLVADTILKARRKPHPPSRMVLEIPHPLHPPGHGDFFDLTLLCPKFSEPIRSNWALIYTRSRWFREKYDREGPLATIELNEDIPEIPFRELHRYLYTDEIEENPDDEALSTSDMMKLLVLARQMKLLRLLQMVEVALSPRNGHKTRGITKFYQWAVPLIIHYPFHNLSFG